MEIINAIILGIIQGLTEFLPVSSSGHLEIAKAILNEKQLPNESLLMTVVLHFATACSTIIVFRKDIKKIISDLVQCKNNNSLHFSGKIILSMFPAILVGVFLSTEIELLFSGKLILVGSMLLITGLLLLLADKTENSERNVSRSNSILIGIAQAIAILPGISRSGATISTSVLLGINKEKAARFSFLMVIPLIFGKMIQDIISGAFSENEIALLPLLIGFIVAFITGILACKWMIRLVKESQLKYFSYYCFCVGGVVILLSIV